MVIYEVDANEYEKMSDLAHGLKKMACKLAKCLEEIDQADYDEEEADDEDYEEDYPSQLRRRGTRYREPADQPNIQDPEEPSMMYDQNGNPVKTRRGRNSRGQYTSMRNRKRMPRSRYDIEVY